MSQKTLFKIERICAICDNRIKSGYQAVRYSNGGVYLEHYCSECEIEKLTSKNQNESKRAS